MISLCILTKDAPELEYLIDMFDRKSNCEFEVCIGDNSTKEEYINQAKEIADEYVRIEDKQLFRMGIPWAHNLINSVANTYKIVYLDSDEFPVWVNPNLEKLFDYVYVIPAVRFDFLTTKEIKQIDKENSDYDKLIEDCRKMPVEKSVQDRIYNSRYAQFEGVCHSIFHVPPHFRGNDAGAILLHNKSVRDVKNKKRMDHLIDEQFMRQNINPMLSSSPVVSQWGKKVKHHRYKNFEDFKKAFE